MSFARFISMGTKTKNNAKLPSGYVLDGVLACSNIQSLNNIGGSDEFI
jgi:hypothetical protein